MAHVASSKLDSDDVLRMSSVASWHVALSAWVSEELDEAVVVTAGDKALVFIKVYTVDMSSISASWEDTINKPSKLGMLCSPLICLRVASSAWVVLDSAFTDVKV